MCCRVRRPSSARLDRDRSLSFAHPGPLAATAMISLPNPTLVFPQTGNLAIHRQRGGTPFAWATVDEFLLPTLNGLGWWYVADMRQLASPHTAFRDAFGRKRHLVLSRAVYALVCGIKDGSLSGQSITLPLLYEKSKHFPPVKFLDRNHFNCQFNNLLIGPTTALRRVGPVDAAVGVIDQVINAPEPGRAVYTTPPVDPMGFEARSPTIAKVRDILRGEDDPA